MATKKEESKEIIIPAIDIQRITLKIVGDSPLIVHKWSKKAKKEILDKQMKKAKAKGHDIRNPVADFVDSLYWLDCEPEEKTEDGFAEAIKNGATFGFPSVALKASAVSGGFQAGTIKKTFGRSAFHIDGELVEISGIPEMREDMVKIGMGTADLRYRGEFKEWSTIFDVRYNAGAISAEQIVSLFNAGGFGIGIGEWRPERDGSYGMYHVE